MPTYDYECDACGHAFELFQSITAPVEKKCPKCGKNKLRRLLGTGAAVMFKGSGFYQTDYRSESYKKAAESEKKASSGDSASTPAADSKSAAKSDSSASSSAKPSAPGAKSDAKRKRKSGD
jgi:putative FmdB family regulatory protein